MRHRALKIRHNNALKMTGRSYVNGQNGGSWFREGPLPAPRVPKPVGNARRSAGVRGRRLILRRRDPPTAPLRTLSTRYWYWRTGPCGTRGAARGQRAPRGSREGAHGEQRLIGSVGDRCRSAGGGVCHVRTGNLVTADEVIAADVADTVSTAPEPVSSRLGRRPAMSEVPMHPRHWDGPSLPRGPPRGRTRYSHVAWEPSGAWGMGILKQR